MATSTMVVETVFTEGVAHLSYLIGDKATGKAAVIDPRRDVEVYIELARKNKLSITHVLETHIHADFVSGTSVSASTKKNIVPSAAFAPALRVAEICRQFTATTRAPPSTATVAVPSVEASSTTISSHASSGDRAASRIAASVVASSRSSL